MNYYQFNEKEILQKAKKKYYSKEKAAEYLLNKEAIQKGYKNMTDKQKQAKKEYLKNDYKKLKAYEDEL